MAPAPQEEALMVGYKVTVETVVGTAVVEVASVAAYVERVTQAVAEVSEVAVVNEVATRVVEETGAAANEEAAVWSTALAAR